jgi:DNA repair exonuclease SbcCD ATPase subunit
MQAALIQRMTAAMAAMQGELGAQRDNATQAKEARKAAEAAVKEERRGRAAATKEAQLAVKASRKELGVMATDMAKVMGELETAVELLRDERRTREGLQVGSCLLNIGSTMIDANRSLCHVVETRRRHVNRGVSYANPQLQGTNPALTEPCSGSWTARGGRRTS